MSEKNTDSIVYAGRSFYMLFKAFKFIVVSYIISIILIAAVAAVVVYTDVPESLMTLSVKIIMFSGAFLSALFTSRKALSKGWICGMFTAIFHVLLLRLIANLAMGADFFSATFTGEIMISALCGFAGGILGVNSSGR